MNPLAARQAALLLAVDPEGLGGICLRDRHGPRRDAWLNGLAAVWPSCRTWRRLPSACDDSRLLGGLDLVASIHAGAPVAQRGVLSECDGGVLLLPMAERLGASRAGILGGVLDNGELAVQREGLDMRLSARLAIVAMDESIADDEQVSPGLADRLGLWLDLAACGAALPLPEASLSKQVKAARARLPGVRCDDGQLKALVSAASALAVVSTRAEMFALRAACAAAALAGRDQVRDEDSQWAARLVLAPRARALPELPTTGGDAPAEVAPPSQAEPERACDALPHALTDAEQTAAAATNGSPERILEAALAALPLGLLAKLAAGRARKGSQVEGKSGAWHTGARRGRPMRSHAGEPRAGARLHLVDTLRAAAPWQRLRRAEGAAASPPVPPDAQDRPRCGVQIRCEDLRVSRRRQRQETTTMFVVDASGSAALHRLAEAKGAVELLLADCYVRRDRVALLAFRAQAGVPLAECLLAPTRSLARARRSLAALPAGGGTPLAAGLDAAWQLAQEQLRRGATPVVVVLSDGRANIARDGSPGRAQAASDAKASARAFAGSGLDLLWLDTAPQPQSQARELADAMGARYLPLPHADAAQMRAALG